MRLIFAMPFVFAANMCGAPPAETPPAPPAAPEAAAPAAPAESANPIHRIPKEYEGALKRGAQHREDAVKEATE
jgi:hypothetical protein